MKAECPICSQEIVSKTEARKTSTMWASLIREAEQENMALVGVCYPCGELIDLNAYANDAEVYQRLHRHVFSARSLGQQMRREAERLYKEADPIVLWKGMSLEDCFRQMDFKRFQAKEQAKRNYINEQMQQTKDE